MSASLKPRVVMAAEPRLIPEVTNGERVSKGTVFLFAVMPALSRAIWASLPVMFLLVRSTRIRWLSVPPETRSNPAASRGRARALELATTWT